MNANQPSLPAHDDRVVCEATDALTAQRLRELRSAVSDEPLTALFVDEAVAAVFDGLHGTTALAWGPVLGQWVADELPPSPAQFVAPPAVVVGDDEAARSIAKAYVEGFSEPGQPLTLHCVGRADEWAQAVRAETLARSVLTWTQLPLRPIPVVRRVAELVSMWDAPPSKRGAVTGPTVVIALDDDVLAVAIGAAVAREMTDARVGVVVTAATGWPDLPGVQLFGRAEAQQRALSARQQPADRLQRFLLADTAWLSAPDAAATRPAVALFAEVARDESGAALGLEAQSGELRQQVAAIVEGIEQILAAGQVVFAGSSDWDAAPVILTPSELSAMAEAILQRFGSPTGPGARLTALELAYRLPSLVTRSGRLIARPDGYMSLLTFDTVERLAPLVHLAYQTISARTGNATDSPLAFEMWGQLTDFAKASNRAVVVGCAVAHAEQGLAWRAAEPVTKLPLTDGLVERLAELEHRRWAINQRRNGAGDHKWMLPWAEVVEDVKDYDRHIMKAMVDILADAGIEIYEEEL